MDDWKSTIVDITKTITKTSGDFLKSTKLSMALSSEESNLKSIYTEIGKKVHEIYAYGGSLGKFFDEKYAEIQTAEAKIDDIRMQLDAAKGTRTCAACGHNAARAAEFCPKCGKGLDGAAPVPEEYTAAPAPSAGRVCGICGKESAAQDKFCLSCGRML